MLLAFILDNISALKYSFLINRGFSLYHHNNKTINLYTLNIKHLLLSVLLLTVTLATAQTNPVLEAQAKAAIKAKGLDETEVRKRLAEKGIDIDNVTPEQLPQLQPTIEAVIAAMEAEKKDTDAIPPENEQETTAQQPATSNPEIQQPETPKPETKNPYNLPPTEIYGHQLFRAKDLALFNTTSDVKPPDSYVLGSGDELTISVFGPSQFDSKFTINKEGYISPSQMPKIFLKGVSLGQARELLRSRFSNSYRFAPEQFAVSLTNARSIVVNIFGEATNAGSFTLAATNTAFNALVAAGGPTELGTVRHIKIIRARTTRNLDLYEMINNPGMQFDFSLENNDIIHVPVADRIVSVQGAVRRPFRYELVNAENLTELLQFAGGLSANALREVIQVKRFVDDRQVLIDVNLKKLQADKQNFVLLSGDEVIVRAIPKVIENTASIAGKIDQPGTYSLTETPRISDLLKKGGLRTDSRTDMAFLLRENADSTKKLIQINPDLILRSAGSPEDLLLSPKDRITVYARSRYADFATFSVTGAVRDFITGYPFPPDSALSVTKAITLAGGLRPDANGLAYIIRTNTNNNKEKSYRAVDLNRKVNGRAEADEILLEPFDRLLVLSALTYSDVMDVNVVGAVRAPGKFPFSPTLTLKDALVLAGGMKLEAASNRIDIYRVDISSNQPTRTRAISVEVDPNYNITGGGTDLKIMPFDEIVVRSVPYFEFQQFVELNGEVFYPGRYALVDNNESLSKIIQRAGGLTGEADAWAATLFRKENNKGLVVTRLNEALDQPGGVEDHILKVGDVINVPKKQNLVTIKGANTDLPNILKAPLAGNNQISAAHHPGKRAGWYVREYAGGFSKDANRKRVYVEQPNGKINRTVNFGLFKKYPKVAKGSVVVVPAKPVKSPKTGKKEGKSIDWDKALTQILAVAGTMATVIVAVVALQKI